MPRRTAHVFGEKWRSDDVKILEQVDFSSLLLSDRVLLGLKRAGYKNPSPIQLEAIPVGRFGKDLIVQAKSGTGKTLVFTIISLEMLLDVPHPQILILAPTREIAFQICGVLNSVGSRFKNFKCVTFIGGFAITDDIEKAEGCQIIVGTPGRVKQLINLKILKTQSIRLFVLDEADQLLDPSFQSDIDAIFMTLPKEKQVIATSATYPKKLKKLADRYFRQPFLARLNINELALLGIIHYTLTVAASQMAVLAYRKKLEALEKVLSSVEFSQCLVFCNLVSRVESLCSDIKKWGFTTTYITSAKEQAARLKAIECLKRFKCKVLVSSDVTSRGIDAENVDLIINFDMPNYTEVYLHRVGRAGRYGSKGAAITFLSDIETAAFEKVQNEGNFKAFLLPDPIPSNLVNLRPDPSSSPAEAEPVPSSTSDSSDEETVLLTSCNDEVAAIKSKPKEAAQEIQDNNNVNSNDSSKVDCSNTETSIVDVDNKHGDEINAKGDDLLKEDSVDNENNISKCDDNLLDGNGGGDGEDSLNASQPFAASTLLDVSNGVISDSSEVGEAFHETLEHLDGNEDKAMTESSAGDAVEFSENNLSQPGITEAFGEYQYNDAKAASSELDEGSLLKSASNISETTISTGDDVFDCNAAVGTYNEIADKDRVVNLEGVDNDDETAAKSKDTELEKKILDPDDITLPIAKFINKYGTSRELKSSGAPDTKNLNDSSAALIFTPASLSSIRDSSGDYYQRVFMEYKDAFVSVNGTEDLNRILRDDLKAMEEKLKDLRERHLHKRRELVSSTSESESSSDCSSLNTREIRNNATAQCVHSATDTSSSDTDSSSSEDEALSKLQLLDKAFKKKVGSKVQKKQPYNPCVEKIKKELQRIKAVRSAEKAEECTIDEPVEEEMQVDESLDDEEILHSSEELGLKPLEGLKSTASIDESVQMKKLPSSIDSSSCNGVECYSPVKKIIQPILKKKRNSHINSYPERNSQSKHATRIFAAIDSHQNSHQPPKGGARPKNSISTRNSSKSPSISADTRHQNSDTSHNFSSIPPQYNSHPKRAENLRQKGCPRSHSLNHVHKTRVQSNNTNLNNVSQNYYNSICPSDHRCHLLSTDSSCNSPSCQSFYEMFYHQWSCIQQASYFY